MRSGILALRDIAANHPEELLTPLVVFAVTLAAGYLVRRFLLTALDSFSKRTDSRPARILAQALRGPILIWVLILAVHVAIQSSALPAQVTRWAPQVLQLLFIFSLTLMCMRVAGDLVRFYGAQIPGAVPVTTLTETLAELMVLIIGVLVILNQLRVSVTPILTALGVGGLAVALALQDTLSNLFAGFYVAVAGQVRVGDYIKMDSGPEGYVTDISWRSTALKSMSNNLVVVPNNKLAQAIVTNFHLPEKRMTTQVQMNVSYNADPEQVEHLLLAIAAKGIGEIPGMLQTPPPSVAWDPGFGESSIAISLNFGVASLADAGNVRNELRRRIFVSFREAGIETPYPTRTVFLRGQESVPGDGHLT